MVAQSPEDVHLVLAEMNPWHHSGEVPSALSPPVERPLAQHLWSRLLHNPLRRFQLIFGPRQVGKTTVLYQTVARLLAQGIEPSRIWWLQVDHPILRSEQLGDLMRLLVETSGANSDRPIFVMLDEVVYADAWDLWLKSFHDGHLPVQIAATASATAVLRDRHFESGVGRWDEQHLAPYSFLEYLELTGGQAGTFWGQEVGWTLSETIRSLPLGPAPDPKLSEARRRFTLVGGFPALLLAYAQGDHYSVDGESELDKLIASQETVRAGAVERTIYRDIPLAYGVDNPMNLERLLHVLASQISGVLSPSNIAKNLGISPPTIDRYLNYLEHSLLVFTLPNYSSMESAVQRRGRKLYFVDGAIRNAVLRRVNVSLDDPVDMGKLLENLMAASMRTLALHTAVRLYHWRDGNKEVDLIYDDPANPLAFEIATSASHNRAGLTALIDRYERFRGNSYLVAPTASVVPAHTSESGIGTLPLDPLLIAVNAQAHKAMMSRLGVRD